MTTAITKLDEVFNSIAANGAKLERVFPPSSMSLDRFLQLCRNALVRSPGILECDRRSIIDSCMRAAELGLDPSGSLGSAYLVSFKGQCTFIPGYRGLIDLMVRSGEVRSIKAEVVLWGDEFDWDEGDKPRLLHKPWYPQTEEEQQIDMGVERKVRAAYAIATLPSKDRQFTTMLFKELESVRLRSPGGKSDKTPWATHRNEMYKKCPIRRIAKQIAINPVKAGLLTRALEYEDEIEKSYADEEREIEKQGGATVGATKVKDALRKKMAEERANAVDAEYAVAGPDTVPEPPEGE
jgi:recombination protein RecT